jgi:uncharacterized protein YceK
MLAKPLSTLRSVFVCTLSLLATALLAQTIPVGPGQTYTTIQSGIDAANPGDTVLVSPGTYNENIDFKGKAITVTSSGGAASTIIDGGNKPGVATVIFANGETNASIISGFTIRGGGDTIFAGKSDGGVYASGASPTIQNNTVTANYCHNIDIEFGDATILNNEVSGVLQSAGPPAPESYCTFGSGIDLQGSSYFAGLGSTVIGNTIENNLTGSGINLWAAQNVLIMNNTIRNNASPTPGSAFISANSTGTVITQNLIYDNSSNCGGAIAPEDGGLTASDPVVLISNNTMVDNVATDTSYGGSNCILIAQIYPGPYSYGQSGPGVLVVNNIISGSTSYPAVNCAWFSPPSLSYQPTFENNILYNAGGPFFGSYCVDVSDQDNNIAADPQFVNPSTGDYHLKSTSPAIDTGQNSALDNFQTMTGVDLSADFDGKSRVQNGSGKGCIIDMGAYEYPATTSNCGTSETLTSSLNPATAGQNVTFTAQLTSTAGTPTGAVQFLDGTNPLSTQTVSGAGSASFTTNALTVGSHTITANYQPTGSFSASTASLVEIINGETTGTVLTCQPNPIDIFGAAQLTATVTSASGTPTGSVSFNDNGALLATNALVAGTATVTYTAPAAGTHTITATYSPTGPFAASSATCSEVVNPLPTTSTLTVAPATATYGSSVTLTATVAPVTLPGPSTPTGVVTFYNGASAVGTGTLAGGVATLASVSLPGGSYNLTCVYGGSSIYATSNCNSVPVVIHAAPTALTLSSSANPAIYGSSVGFTVRLTVNGQSAGAGNTIQLSINGQIVILTTDATGSAIYYATGLLAPNSYPITASFAGTNDLLASSASLTQVITASPTSISLTGTPNPGDLNQPISLTATVSKPSSSSSSTLLGSGSVFFYDGSTLLGSAPVAANSPPLTGSVTANFTASFSTLGVHNLTAVYAGDADFLTSTSAVFDETIVAGDFSISVTPTTASLYTGEAATAQVTVASLQGFNQLLNLTCSGLPANATCSFTPSTLPTGQGAAKLVIQTAAPHETAAAAASISVLGALTLLLLPGKKRRRGFFARLSLVLLAVGVALGISGCASVRPITGGTPPGTYQVQVTAFTVGTTVGTAAALTHSAVVNLTVKSLF